jgi:hypothetical protein
MQGHMQLVFASVRNRLVVKMVMLTTLLWQAPGAM